MIAPATNLRDRVEAAEFSQSVVLPEIDAPTRRQAITRSLQSGHFAIDFVDRNASALQIASGCLDFPIWTYRDGDDLVGVALCSGVLPEMPPRLQMLAVRADHRGEGISAELVSQVIESAPVVGVAIGDDGLRRYYDRLGFTHWHDGASGASVGFSASIDPRRDLIFAVPVATDHDIAVAEAALRSEAGDA